MSIGIYKIENLINHKVYIGQSVRIEKRWQQHCNTQKSLIGQAIQKYGKENFSFQILEECSYKDLDKKEAQYIKKYNCITPLGYNIREESNSCASSQFIKLNKLEFLSLVNDIKNSDISFKDLAKKYDLDLSMIYYINRGDFHQLEEEQYPLRQVQDFSKQYHYCIDCGKEIKTNALRCPECSHIANRKCQRPEREELKKLIRTTSFVELGKQFGVTDNAIKKWCKSYDLPSRRCDIKSYTNEDWNKI